MKCSNCNIDMNETNESIETTFRNEDLRIERVHHFVCPQCGEIEIPAEELTPYSEKLKQAYRTKTGLLLPEDIRALRKQYGLRQQEFEQVIGVSFPTCSRWENGTSIPSLPANKLMQEAIENPPTMQRLMKRSGIEPRKQPRKQPRNIVALPTEQRAKQM